MDRPANIVGLASSLSCNSPAVRTFQIVFALGLICAAAVVFRCALKGRIKPIMLFRVVVEGKDASLGAAVFSAFAILIGLVVPLAGILRLDC
jgi:hypothetical protein